MPHWIRSYEHKIHICPQNTEKNPIKENWDFGWEIYGKDLKTSIVECPFCHLNLYLATHDAKELRREDETLGVFQTILEAAATIKTQGEILRDQ
jgi:hypothetical protein